MCVVTVKSSYDRALDPKNGRPGFGSYGTVNPISLRLHKVKCSGNHGLDETNSIDQESAEKREREK